LHPSKSYRERWFAKEILGVWLLGVVSGAPIDFIPVLAQMYGAKICFEGLM